MVSLLDRLVECGAVRFGEFTLTSGRTSPYYVDVKAAATRPAVLRELAAALAPHAAGHRRLAGTELGAVPLLVAVSLATDLPYAILRKEGRSHGTGREIEGALEAGDRVLLVEDVATTGGTLARAVRVLRDREAAVDRAVCVVDREEGAAGRLADLGVSLSSLIRARDLLDAAP